MKKLFLLVLSSLIISCATLPQESIDTNVESTNVTTAEDTNDTTAEVTDDANTVSIDGRTYYYLPSTTPSSPIPNLERATAIDTGSWYGEDAILAWVAMRNWIIENSTSSNRAVSAGPGERLYITSVHSYKGNTPESRRYAIGASMNFGVPSLDGITIYYWIVPKGAPIENGEREYRSFALGNW